MSRAVKIFVVGLIVGGLVPAVVFARFDGSETFAVNTQTYDSIGAATTDSNQFQPLEGLEISPSGVGAQITLSAVMTSGRAKFRFASEDFDPRPLPVPEAGVTFTAPAANSYAFFERDGCGNFSVEWRRVGNQTAKLSTAALQSAGDSDAC